MIEKRNEELKVLSLESAIALMFRVFPWSCLGLMI